MPPCCAFLLVQVTPDTAGQVASHAVETTGSDNILTGPQATDADPVEIQKKYKYPSPKRDGDTPYDTNSKHAYHSGPEPYYATGHMPDYDSPYGQYSYGEHQRTVSWLQMSTLHAVSDTCQALRWQAQPAQSSEWLPEHTTDMPMAKGSKLTASAPHNNSNIQSMQAALLFAPQLLVAKTLCCAVLLSLLLCTGRLWRPATTSHLLNHPLPPPAPSTPLSTPPRCWGPAGDDYRQKGNHIKWKKQTSRHSDKRALVIILYCRWKRNGRSPELQQRNLP